MGDVTSIDSHEMVRTLKELAIELGRTPLLHEFCEKVPGGHYRLRKLGGFAILCQMAGLSVQKNGSKPAKLKKPGNEVFEKDIEKHLDAYEAARKIVLARPTQPTIASISDIHWPFHNQAVIDAFLAFILIMQPDYVILNGDAWDMYCHGKFPRSHNVFTPREEERLARQKNEEFWRRVREACPQTKCVQMLGNHDVRPLKRLIEAAPTLEDWVGDYFRKAFSFDGVETIFDARQEYVVGDVMIFHGYRTGLGAHRDYTMRNCINGHTHRGGTVFRKIKDHVIWELNSGYAGDPNTKGLSYTAQKSVEWTPGFAVVDAHGPRFIPIYG